jgi:hypothetical protein
MGTGTGRWWLSQLRLLGCTKLQRSSFGVDLSFPDRLLRDGRNNRNVRCEFKTKETSPNKKVTRKIRKKFVKVKFFNLLSVYLTKLKMAMADDSDSGGNLLISDSPGNPYCIVPGRLLFEV